MDEAPAEATDGVLDVAADGGAPGRISGSRQYRDDGRLLTGLSPHALEDAHGERAQAWIRKPRRDALDNVIAERGQSVAILDSASGRSVVSRGQDLVEAVAFLH